MLQADYTGKLTDGTVFDSSKNAGRTPLEFTVGVGQVIPGWDQVRVRRFSGSRMVLLQ